MKTKTKALALALCAVLLVVSTVFVTMAYLTSQDSVTNTFTVGQVNITLDEAKVDEYGNPVDEGGKHVELASAPRQTGNEYKLIPGHTYTKDPTVNVDSSSEDCYLFVKIENGLGTDGTIAGLETNGWALVDQPTNIYVYKGTGTDGKLAVSKNAKIKVFDTFTFGEKANPETHTNNEIIVTAYAIQADGLSEKTPAEIWALFK